MNWSISTPTYKEIIRRALNQNSTLISIREFFFKIFIYSSKIILQCESGFIESPLSEITCWFFSDCWVRPHTSNHLCLPSRDWPVFWIRNFVYFCWPIRRRKTKMIRRVGANPAIWISPFCRFRVIWPSMIKDSYGRMNSRIFTNFQKLYTE